MVQVLTASNGKVASDIQKSLKVSCTDVLLQMGSKKNL